MGRKGRRSAQPPRSLNDGVEVCLPRPMDTFLDALQWPAMLVTLVASWWVGSTHRRKRAWGFWAYLLGNLLWTAWGWHTSAVALILLQLCLAAMNIRGWIKARRGAMHGSS